MAKRIAMTFAVYTFAAITAAAQQATPSAGSSPSSRTTGSTTGVNISGRFSDDGKTLVDSRGVTWSIINADAVGENIGVHVVVRGRVDAGKREIEVNSVRIDTSAGARLHDVAFRK